MQSACVDHCLRHAHGRQSYTWKQDAWNQNKDDDFGELSPCPNNRMGTPIPYVAGFQHHLEELLLMGRAWLLMQGRPVPEHRHVHDAVLGPLSEVHSEEVRHHLQVEPRRVGMTFGS